MLLEHHTSGIFNFPNSYIHHLLGPLTSQPVTEKANAVFVVSAIKENANACIYHLTYLSTTYHRTYYPTICDFKFLLVALYYKRPFFLLSVCYDSDSDCVVNSYFSNVCHGWPK